MKNSSRKHLPILWESSRKDIPILWEDDYCQVELIPQENLSFVQQQMDQIKKFAQEHFTENGFTEIIERDHIPISTRSQEIRTEYLKSTLPSFGLPELPNFQYGAGKIKSTKTSRTKAYGFPSFTLFFDTEEEFVSNIWLDLHLITSVTDYEVILSSLYYLGEELNFVIADWNGLVIIDPRDKVKLNKYLMGWRK